MKDEVRMKDEKGIAEEQSTRKETLKLCLDGIRACRPFFIGLLGERAGCVPGEDAFTADLREEQSWLKDLHGKSITASNCCLAEFGID